MDTSCIVWNSILLVHLSRSPGIKIVLCCISQANGVSAEFPKRWWIAGSIRGVSPVSLYLLWVSAWHAFKTPRGWVDSTHSPFVIRYCTLSTLCCEEFFLGNYLRVITVCSLACSSCVIRVSIFVLSFLDAVVVAAAKSWRKCSLRSLAVCLDRDWYYDSASWRNISTILIGYDIGCGIRSFLARRWIVLDEIFWPSFFFLSHSLLVSLRVSKVSKKGISPTKRCL